MSRFYVDLCQGIKYENMYNIFFKKNFVMLI